MRILHLNQTHYINKILKNLYMQLSKYRVISISFNEYDALYFVDLTD